MLGPEAQERLNRIAEKVIGCAFAVANELGHGFLEKVYENAMLVEIALAGLKVESQKQIPVYYKGVIVGEYIADLLVEGCIITELKCVEALAPIHKAQTLNYLKATGLSLGLLLNFQTPRVEVKRIVNDF